MRKMILIMAVLLLFVAQNSYSSVKLIWQIDPDAFCEGDWIREVLADIDCEEVVDKRFEVVVDNAIVVISSQSDEILNRYFDKFWEKNCRFGVIQISDENYSAPCAFYPYAQFVFRNYWNQKFAAEINVTTFPLGYMNGFWRHCPNVVIPCCSDRQYTWCFAGQIKGKPTRMAMIRNMRLVPNNYIHEIYAFRGAGSIPVSAFRDLLLNTVFIPCPRGFVNLDSFRIYEALECGCIPIVERGGNNYFANFLGDYPFPTVDSWTEAPLLIQSLLDDPVRLEGLRLKCYNWWQTYKINMKSKMKCIINEAFEN